MKTSENSFQFLIANPVNTDNFSDVKYCYKMLPILASEAVDMYSAEKLSDFSIVLCQIINRFFLFICQSAII